jgi:hypothetical protein
MLFPVNLGLWRPQLSWPRSNNVAANNGDARINFGLFTLVDAGQKGLFRSKDWD